MRASFLVSGIAKLLIESSKIGLGQTPAQELNHIYITDQKKIQQCKRHF